MSNQKSVWMCIFLSEIHNFLGVCVNGDCPRHGARRAVLGAATLMGALAGVVFLFHQVIPERTRIAISDRSSRLEGWWAALTLLGTRPGGRSTLAPVSTPSGYIWRKCDITDKWDTAAHRNRSGYRPTERDNATVDSCPVPRSRKRESNRSVGGPAAVVVALIELTWIPWWLHK